MYLPAQLSLCFLQCGDPFQEEDLIVLNGTKEEVETLQQRMQEKRAKAKAGKVGYCSLQQGSTIANKVFINY